MPRNISLPQVISIFVLLLLSTAICPGQSAPDKRVMTNQNVLEMVKANLSASVIVKSIESAESVDFDVTPDSLIELKKAGTDDKIIEAMMNASKAKPVDKSASARKGSEKKDDKKEKKDEPDKFPEIVINADVEVIRGQAIRDLIKEGFTLERETASQLVFNKKIGGAGGFMAGMLVGRDQQNPRHIVTFIFAKGETGVLTSIQNAILYPDKNGQGIPRNVDSKKVRRETMKYLEELKAKSEKP